MDINYPTPQDDDDFDEWRDNQLTALPEEGDQSPMDNDVERFENPLSE